MAKRAAPIEFRPLDSAALSGRSFLVREGDVMALGRWNGEAWVYPATGGRALDITPEAYHDPDWRRSGAYGA